MLRGSGPSDLRQGGSSTLDPFNAGAAEQIWYFEALMEICLAELPLRLAPELDDLLSAIREMSIGSTGQATRKRHPNSGAAQVASNLGDGLVVRPMRTQPKRDLPI